MTVSKAVLIIAILCVCRITPSFSQELKQDCLESSPRLEFTKIQDKSSEQLDNYSFYKKIIEKKENDACYDSDYIKALYNALPIASSIDQSNVSTIMSKLQVHDKEHCPVVKVENGWMIMENLPECMLDKENIIWIKEILEIFGVKVTDGDIEYQKNSISIKMPTCGLCPRCNCN